MLFFLVERFPVLIFLFYSQILEKVKIAYDIPIVTDVHETTQVKYLVLFNSYFMAFLQVLSTDIIWHTNQTSLILIICCFKRISLYAC